LVDARHVEKASPASDVLRLKKNAMLPS